MTARPTIDPTPFLSNTCRSRTRSCASCPADPVRDQRAAPGGERLLHARRADAGRGAAAARLVRALGEYLGIARPGERHRTGARGARPATACCRACSRTPRATAATSSATGRGSSATAAPSRSARSSPRDGSAPGAAAQGRRHDALLAHRRRPRGAALVAARVRVQRGDARPRRADHARAEPRRHRRAGDPRHVLRRPSGARARRGGVPRRAVVRALRQFPDPRRATASSTLLKRLADYVIREHFYPGARPYAGVLPGGLPAHRAADGRLDARWASCTA